jgi:hypothetical protein
MYETSTPSQYKDDSCIWRLLLTSFLISLILLIVKTKFIYEVQIESHLCNSTLILLSFVSGFWRLSINWRHTQLCIIGEHGLLCHTMPDMSATHWTCVSTCRCAWYIDNLLTIEGEWIASDDRGAGVGVKVIVQYMSKNAPLSWQHNSRQIKISFDPHSRCRGVLREA